MWLPQPRHHTWKGENHHNTSTFSIFQVSLSMYFLSLTVRGGRGLRGGPTCPHTHTEQEMSPNWHQSRRKSGPMFWVPHRTDSHPVSRWIGSGFHETRHARQPVEDQLLLIPTRHSSLQSYWAHTMGQDSYWALGGQNQINPHHILKDSVIQRSEVCVDSKWSTI